MKSKKITKHKKKTKSKNRDYTKTKKKFLSNESHSYDAKKKKKFLSNDDKKKKKFLSNDDKKKKKKSVSNINATIDYAKISKSVFNKLDDKTKGRAEIVDGMKDKICSIRNPTFSSIDVSDRTPYWGLGVEHEMQIFHKSKSGMKNTNIMFNSQESTCFMTNEKNPSGSCCKTKPKCDNFSDLSKKYGDFGLTEEEKQFLLRMQWELSGRQAKSCEPNKKITQIFKRVPVLMPELITTDFSNRTIDSIWKEIVELEEQYLKIHMKNPHTKQKVDKYGPLTTHMCGAHSNILIPETPTFQNKEYIIKTKPMTDYLGSYHITITLPHTKDILLKDYINMHKYMAQQIQWIEPLLVTAFFSPTQSAVGNKNDPQGSYRVMINGWGNFAGSDLRKMGKIGLDRGSNMKLSKWRKGLKFTGMEKLEYCVKRSKPQYAKSKTIHTGDFRTFGIENDIAKCERLYNPNDCPRADGAPIKPPFGIEIRIFDHFPVEYLIQLMRIVVLIAANAQRHPPKDYVYSDKRWIDALQNIMKDGWDANVDSKYITALRKNLGLPINTNSLLAYDVFKTIVHELYDINKNSFINKIMNEHPNVEPVLPQINRMCWELAFTQNFNLKFINFLKRNFHNDQTVSFTEFKNMLKNDKQMDFETWGKNSNDLSDLLYALESKGHVHLDIFNGKIQNVKIIM